MKTITGTLPKKARHAFVLTNSNIPRVGFISKVTTVSENRFNSARTTKTRKRPQSWTIEMKNNTTFPPISMKEKMARFGLSVNSSGGGVLSLFISFKIIDLSHYEINIASA